MRITYDPLADALYIQFVEPAKPLTTKHLAEGIAADYDARGRLAGLEILDVGRRCGGRDPRAERWLDTDGRLDYS